MDFVQNLIYDFKVVPHARIALHLGIKLSSNQILSKPYILRNYQTNLGDELKRT